MCGIIAYLGKKDAYQIILNGLKRLEYRGYDSAGIAILKDNLISIKKEVGKVNELGVNGLQGDIGVGHTRWATHGKPSKENAHPHHNKEESIALVHNGIIENYSLLKKKLVEKGYTFYSETDTEVLTKLVDYHWKKAGDLEQGIKNAIHEIVGAYGVVIINKDEEKLYAIRKGSPLVLGIGSIDGDNGAGKEFFVASDPAAFLDHTKRVLYLEDNDFVVIDRNNFELKNICDGHERCVNRDVTDIKWDLSKIEKNGFDHFMLKEIFEQPETIKQCLAGRIDKEKWVPKLSLDSSLSDNFLKSLDRVIITACGTSWHAALVGKFLIEKYCRIPVEVEVASEFRYKNPIIGEKDLFIVVSQSGETADTLAALKEAKQKGAKTFGFVNVVGSTISREVDSGIYIHAGPEISVASTKAFTGQVTSLIMFTINLGLVRGEVSLDKCKVMLKKLEGLPNLISEVLECNGVIKNIAEKLIGKKSCFFLGRSINVSTALEGSLKMKEISYIHSEAFPAAEMKHGPIALLEEGFPVINIIPKNDPIYEKILSNVEEVSSRGAMVINIANVGDSEIDNKSNYVIKVPEVDDFLQPIVFSVALQLLSYYTALGNGCDIDMPKNLAKSVTVE